MLNEQKNEPKPEIKNAAYTKENCKALVASLEQRKCLNAAESKTLLNKMIEKSPDDFCFLLHETYQARYKAYLRSARLQLQLLGLTAASAESQAIDYLYAKFAHQNYYRGFLVLISVTSQISIFPRAHSQLSTEEFGNHILKYNLAVFLRLIPFYHLYKDIGFAELDQLKRTTTDRFFPEILLTAFKLQAEIDGFISDLSQTIDSQQSEVFHSIISNPIFFNWFNRSIVSFNIYIYDYIFVEVDNSLQHEVKLASHSQNQERKSSVENREIRTAFFGELCHNFGEAIVDLERCKQLHKEIADKIVSNETQHPQIFNPILRFLNYFSTPATSIDAEVEHAKQKIAMAVADDKSDLAKRKTEIEVSYQAKLHEFQNREEGIADSQSRMNADYCARSNALNQNIARLQQKIKHTYSSRLSLGISAPGLDSRGNLTAEIHQLSFRR